MTDQEKLAELESYGKALANHLSDFEAVSRGSAIMLLIKKHIYDVRWEIRNIRDRLGLETTDDHRTVRICPACNDTGRTPEGPCTKCVPK